MAQSARSRRRRGKEKEDEETTKATNNDHKKMEEELVVLDDQEEDEADDEELFKVEKIVDSKVDKNGVSLYKTRWKGYSASDDTWEPTENVASTGHVDRYERLQRQRTLKNGTPGVAVIEYEDGESEMVDMKIEKFRSYQDDVSDNERDDDTENGDEDVNNFNLLAVGEWVEILWPYTQLYFPCKIISCTPIRAVKRSKKRARREDSEDVEVLAVEKKSIPRKKQKERVKQPPTKKAKTGGNDNNTTATSVPASTKEPPEQELPTQEDEGTEEGFCRDTNISMNNYDGGEAQQLDTSEEYSSGDEGYASDRIVERTGHGIPLFDEPEDDFSDDDDESEDDSDSDDNGEGFSSYQYPKNLRQLTFEEQWNLKLQRTQEMMDRNALDENDMSAAMARQL